MMLCGRVVIGGVPNPKTTSVINNLASSCVAIYAYDANGNTLSDAQGRSFTWDFENRLTQATNPGVGTTTFRYDPFGRRIQKSGPLGITNYLYKFTVAILLTPLIYGGHYLIDGYLGKENAAKLSEESAGQSSSFF